MTIEDGAGREMKYRATGARLASSFRESAWPVRIAAASLSVAFAASTVIGSMAANGQFSEDHSIPVLFFTATKALLTSVVFFLALLPVLHMASRAEGLASPTYAGLWAMPPVRRRLTIFGTLALPWFFYWVVLWPGVTTVDSYNQILQAWGIISYADHHPILQTLFIQTLFQPALAVTGSADVAIGFVSLIQMLVLATIVSLCIDALRHFGAPGWMLTGTLLFFSLHPIIGWYSVTLWKDVWLGASTLAVATIVALILREMKSQKATKWSMWALLFIALFVMLASKKSALYIVLPTILVVALMVRRRNLLRWLGVTVGSVMVYLAVHAGVMYALDVQPGSEVEAWSMPSQQIARVVAEHGESLSEDQVQSIETYFPDVDLAELYRPGLSDPVKGALDATRLSSNRLEFLSLWFELGREYPGTYIAAFVYQTYGYWDPDVSYWVVSDLDWRTLVEWYAADGNGTEFLAEQAPAKYLIPDGAKLAATDFVNIQLRDVPVIGWSLSLGAWTWITAVLGVIAALRRQTIAIVISVISGMVWLSAMLSPVFAEARYLFPMLLLLPLLSVVTFQQRTTRPQKAISEDEELTRA